jgi:hypothetical protein
MKTVFQSRTGTARQARLPDPERVGGHPRRGETSRPQPRFSAKAALQRACYAEPEF